MAFTVGATAAKDSAGTAIAGGLLSADVAGGGVGPTFLFQGLVDGVAGVNKAQISAANALKVDGSAVTQPVSGTVTANAGTGTQAVSLASVPSHAVTNAGTFAVQAAEADGANVTLGAKADAKSTATDVTPISAMSVLKQISASVQAPPSQAVTNAGTFAVQAAATLAAETTKVIGTVNVAAAQTIAVTNAGTFAVQAAATLAAETTKVIGTVNLSAAQTLATLTTLTGTTTLTPGTGATNLGKAADAVAGATDTGVAILAIRDDALTTLTPVDGDYAPLRVNSTGALHVTGGGGGTEYTEDAAAAADPTGQVLLAVRRDTLSASEVSADGDNIALKATNKGKLHVAAELRFGDIVADIGSGVMGSGTQRFALATDSPGIFAVAGSSLATGANSISMVLAKDSIKYVTVDMTADTAILAAGDVVADTQIVTACTPANDAPGILQSIVLVDPDDQGAALTLVFFSANTSLGTENAAPSISDANAQTVLGVINIATTDYVDLGLNKVATIRNVGLPILPAASNDDIYMAIFVTAGTPTYAGGHIYTRLGFM